MAWVAWSYWKIICWAEEEKEEEEESRCKANPTKQKPQKWLLIFQVFSENGSQFFLPKREWKNWNRKDEKWGRNKTKTNFLAPVYFRFLPIIILFLADASLGRTEMLVWGERRALFGLYCIRTVLHSDCTAFGLYCISDEWTTAIGFRIPL